MTNVEISRLAEAARRAAQNAYAPYSGFFVGAAMLGKSGTVYTGCNIENASFSPTICAERCAVAKAVSGGEREFLAIAVCGGPGGKLDRRCTPCGVCRQVLREFCEDDFPVILAGPEDWEVLTLGDLLPHSFSAASLAAKGE